MNEIATDVTTPLCEGRVLEAENGNFSIVVAEEVATAARAAGCLLLPRAGDTVLLYRRAPHVYLILSVLEREGVEDAELALDAPARLTCPGTLRVEAGDGLTFAAPAIRSEADELSLHAAELQVQARRSSVTLGALTVLAEKVDAVILFLLQKLGRSCRKVETTEEIHAARIEIKADEVLQAQSKYTVMLSDEITRIDGKQIQMG